MAKRSSRKASGPPKFTGGERIVVLIGDEPFLMTDYTRQLREATAAKVDSEVDTITFDGGSAELADVLDELRSVGLMMQHKLVVVEQGDEFIKRYRAQMERYAADTEPTATLLLRASKWNKGNIDKAIAKVGLIHQCADPKPAEAATWLVGRARSAHGFEIDRPAAGLLVERIGPDLGRLEGELAKLSAAVPQGQVADRDVVSALVGRASDDDQLWSRMQQALLSGDPREALETVYELTELASVSPVPLMRAASDLAVKLSLAARMLRDRQNDFDICKSLKIWPQSNHRPFIAMAKRLGPAGSAKLAAQIVNFDRRSKSGFGDARRGLEQFCVLLTA